MHRPSPVALALGVVLCVAPALGAQIVLKNGDRVSGQIEHADAKTVTVTTDAAGELGIPWGSIAQITSSAPLYVVTAETTLFGPVTTDSNDLVIATGNGPARVPLASTPILRSETEQAAYERGLHPGLLNDIQGAGSVGFTIARGNSQTTNLAVGLTSARTTPWDRLSMNFASLYASDSTGTTANDVYGGVRYDRNATKTAFAFVSADFEHNEPEFLDLRQVYTLGAGLHAINRDSTSLDLFGGGNYTHEVYHPAPTNSEGGATLGEQLSLAIGSGVGFNETFFAYPDLTNMGQYRATFDGRLTVRVRAWLSCQAAVSDRYVSNPPLGALRNDFTFTTGLNVTFAH